MYTLDCWSKLQRNVEITALFCMHIIRDRKDQLDNKVIATKNLLKEMNIVETILDNFRCSQIWM